MCGRFTLHSSPALLAAEFGVATLPLLVPRYNIAPTQPIAVVRLDPHTGERICVLTRWGLVPSWAEDSKIGTRLINARSETVAEKPSFRAAFRRRRCLIPADGYYEWQKTAAGKRPFLIRLSSKGLLAFAGLWETWPSPDGSALETCTLLTTAANEQLRPIHDRMPVILDGDARRVWLDPDSPSPALQELLQSTVADALTSYAVSTRVNSPAYDAADCLQPA